MNRTTCIIRNRHTLHLAVLLAGALLLAPASPAHAQIVNTLGGWADTTLGWTGKVGAGGKLSGGNTDVKSASGAARAQWQNEAYRVRVLGSFEIEDANGVRAKEAGMFHLRGVRRLSAVVAPFSFVQFQRNRFTRLKTRWLLGAGSEFVLTPRRRWTLAVGASPMLEVETLEDSNAGATARGRLSTFVRLDWPIAPRTRLSTIGFYQPRLDEPRDYRSSVNSSLDVGLVGPLGIQVLGSWEHDDRPPAGVKADDWETRFGVTLGL